MNATTTPTAMGRAYDIYTDACAAYEEAVIAFSDAYGTPQETKSRAIARAAKKAVGLAYDAWLMIAEA
jgi:hypothetical protein